MDFICVLEGLQTLNLTRSHQCFLKVWRSLPMVSVGETCARKWIPNRCKIRAKIN